MSQLIYSWGYGFYTNFRQSDLGIIEPTEKSYQTGRGLVAKALVHASNKVPIRMINLSNETEKNYSGRHVANLSFVSKV